MTTLKVNVKWGKQKYDNIELNTQEPPLVFKIQLFTLTGVAPENQKIMVKGGTLKDEANWADINIKDGHTFMLMGTAQADIPKIPTEKSIFVEDLSSDMNIDVGYPAGLTNLGNTCYMNATLQCLRAVPELQQALTKYPGNITAENSHNVTVTMRDLFTTVSHTPQPFPPIMFLQSLRTAFPQFAQKGNNGEFMQQDAEECWTQIMITLSQKLAKIGAPSEEKNISIKFCSVTTVFWRTAHIVLKHRKCR